MATELAAAVADAFLSLKLPRTEEAADKVYAIVRAQIERGETPDPVRACWLVKRELEPC